MVKFSQAFSANPDIDKEDLNDFLHWIKQIIGIILGCLAGYFKLTGFAVFIGVVVVLSALSMVYVWSILRAEEIEA